MYFFDLKLRNYIAAALKKRVEEGFVFSVNTGILE